MDNRQHPLLPRRDGTWTRAISPQGEATQRIRVTNGPHKGALYEFVSARLDPHRKGWLIAHYRVIGFNPVGVVEHTNTRHRVRAR